MRTNTFRLLTACLVSLLALGGANASAQTSCPADTESTRYVAHAFLSDSDYADLRTEAGLYGVDPTQLRTLGSNTDATRCQQLSAITAPGGVVGPSLLFPWTFYTVGGRYMLVSTTPPSTDPNVVVLGHDVIVVLDGSLNVVAEFMM